MGDLVPEIVANSEEFKRIRRLLHAQPEAAFEEYQTSSLVTKKLKEWGIDVHSDIGGTGIVGVLRGRSGPKSIGLRADMDALPMEEGNTFPHRSRISGRMHACGHDGHTTMLLAAAHHLAQRRAFKGVVNFIFQPAEEDGSGAARMIQDGLFERFPCDAIFALHNWPGLVAGTFATRPGAIMASCNKFKITIYGKGGHAAMPEQNRDPILVAAHVVSALQSVVSRNSSPLDSVVLSVTYLQGGTGFNITPDDAQIGGTVRTFSLSVLDMVERRMESICKLTAQTYGCDAQFSFYRQSIPTVNDVDQTSFALDTMRSIVGPDKVSANIEPTMGAEDFAYMLAKKPGCYAFIGNDAETKDLEKENFGLHHPRYDFNDHLIPLGASYWVRLTHAFLG